MSSEQKLAVDYPSLVEALKVDLTTLAGTTHPEVFTLDFCDVFNAAWYLLTEAAQKEKDFTNLAIGLPRGFGKSAMIKLFCLHAILFSPKKFILLTAANQAKANSLLADIRMSMGQPNIKELFGNWELDKEIDRADLLKFTWRGKSVVIAALGSGGDPRGLNINYVRPDLMLSDDVQSRENSRSKTEYSTLRDWLFATLFKANSKTGCLTVYIGNMYPGDFCILKELKQSPDWVSFIAGALLQDGTSIWEELVSTKQLYAELARDVRAENAHIFFSEVLNDSSTQSLTNFDPSKLLKWGNNNEEIPESSFIIIDPAGAKATSDDTVILLVKVFNHIPWAFKKIQGKFTPIETIKSALQLGLDNNTRLICVESYAYQASLLYWFTQYVQNNGLQGFIFKPLTRGTKSKNSSIMSSLNQVHRGEIGIHPHIQAEYLFQASVFNPDSKSNKDDLLDTVAYIELVRANYTQFAITTIEGYNTIVDRTPMKTFEQLRIV